MKKELLFLLVLWTTIGLGQPPICMDANPDMTPFCDQACIICDIDGFTGRHDSNVVGELPGSFCTFFVHNAQWIAFIAGSENLTINLAVSNCDNNDGLEIAIYEAIDCENFNLISNCYGGVTGPINEGQSGNITVNQPLVIGQYYYLAMDGVLGDNCDWTLTVLEGTTEVSPLYSSGMIEGDNTVCPGITTTYTTTGEAGAVDYSWTLNGSVVGTNATEVAIEWEQEGTYQLCVTASNACDEAPPSCYSILVEEIPEQFFEVQICEGEEYIVDENTVITTSGTHEVVYTSVEGCDSTHVFLVEVLPINTVDFEVTICNEDSIWIGGVPFFEEGQYTEVLTNEYGCDSIVNLDLTAIECLIQGEVATQPTICHGETSGQIIFYIDSGTPPFTYSCQDLLGNIVDGGTVTSLNETLTIGDVAPTTYTIVVEDGFGNQTILIAYVEEPPVLLAETTISNISCYGENDGSIGVSSLGGQSPYSIVWQHGDTTFLSTSLYAGIYTATITDDLGCEYILEDSVLEPMPLMAEVAFYDATCEGENTGYIEVSNVEGGVGNYNYRINEEEWTTSTLFQHLEAGVYTLWLEDANGCLLSSTDTLTSPIIPIIELNADEQIDLGLSTSIDLWTNIDPTNSVSWSGGQSLSCYDCASPIAQPFTTTTYIVELTSVDGCTRQDSISIQVIPNRRTYVPNAFSPNGDGINDFFVIFGAIELANINSFEVYSRWGDLLYRETDLSPNVLSRGWDGRANGEPLATGVYVWSIEVEYLDGIKEQLSGDILLIR